MEDDGLLILIFGLQLSAQMSDVLKDSEDGKGVRKMDWAGIAEEATVVGGRKHRIARLFRSMTLRRKGEQVKRRLRFEA